MAYTFAEFPESLWTHSTPGFFRLATIPEASLISVVSTVPTCLPGRNVGDCAPMTDDKRRKDIIM
jgi:hypothetical protein